MGGGWRKEGELRGGRAKLIASALDSTEFEHFFLGLLPHISGRRKKTIGTLLQSMKRKGSAKRMGSETKRPASLDTPSHSFVEQLLLPDIDLDTRREKQTVCVILIRSKEGG